MWSPRHSTPNKEEEKDEEATRDDTGGMSALLRDGVIVVKLAPTLLPTAGVRRTMSDVWVDSQPRPRRPVASGRHQVALSCIRKASGGGGGNPPLVTRQVATGDILTGGSKLLPRVSGRVGDG